MPESSFGVTYAGDALEDGTMPVRDLAPALLALGAIFSEASALLYPDRELVSLNIKATERGSFYVQLALHAKATWDDIVDLFGSGSANALANLEAIVIGGGTGVCGLFALIRHLRHRKIVDRQLSSGHTRLTLDDGTTFDVPPGTAVLYESASIRAKARVVVAPLEREGVEELTFTPAYAEPSSISKDDLPAFEPEMLTEETLTDYEQEMVIQVASVAFTEGNKWRFSDGQRTFFAAIEDESFMERVQRAIEVFRNGDMLRCRVRVVQSTRGSSLHTDFHVLEVLEHIQGAAQLEFPE